MFYFLKTFFVTPRFFFHPFLFSIFHQGGRGHWAVYFTSPQSFIVTFSFSLAKQLWGFLLNFDWLVFEVECPNFQPVIVIYRRSNFVYHH